MKLYKTILMAAIAISSLSACSQNKQKDMNENKTLVVYFSATGTTKNVANKLANMANADICEIVPQQIYTDDDLNWHNSHSRSSVEMNDPNSRPTIKDMEINPNNYDRIFIGYPIWWDLAPRTINTFIEKYKLEGKSVIPFATSGGSSITNSVENLKKLYPDINWQKGKLLNNPTENNIRQIL